MNRDSDITMIVLFKYIIKFIEFIAMQRKYSRVKNRMHFFLEKRKERRSADASLVDNDCGVITRKNLKKNKVTI
ncbi:hypothetical protein C9J27_02265 [Photobacterium kishitanii]|uniref:Uncharacterized protein n=1 Tax=Photobacterium kishitanii TaxID=318456 RepID=A0A2T3KM69_9GAMM|nr:hypothetical protein C9J27_02265 [Photobacterium kishitanii]